MISDILSDAANEIRAYQEREPRVYEDDKEKIDDVVAQMDALRTYFDKGTKA